MKSLPFQQLLCLVLQAVSILSMSPAFHKQLSESGLTDNLTQLVLPSDEWYYTNHSTQYARYVKHHAARVLVYLGHELRIKMNLFDKIGNYLCVYIAKRSMRSQHAVLKSEQVIDICLLLY